jgi:hypothetical protein
MPADSVRQRAVPSSAIVRLTDEVAESPSTPTAARWRVRRFYQRVEKILGLPVGESSPRVPALSKI